MNPKLYEIRAGDTYGSSYAYATGYAPLADRKSFVHPKMKERNDEFIKLCGSRPGIEIDSSKRLWPDILFCGGGHVRFFVSQKVVDDLKTEGIELLDVTEFPIDSIENNKKSRLKLEEAPRYFVVEAASQLKLYIDKEPSNAYKFTYELRNYTGKDLISNEGYYNHWLFCTQRIVDLAEDKKWTNIEFKPVEPK
ncbi:hypothetical protein QEH52_19085 [Coraliomargarita sp. SDUM461003]|uniref:Uncharacterized protein n=1 Tax=Thalassobacterium maritimum TaxID=3041265 RepID=A0ABU1B2I2_9BACT|nr:hypothetical protein [Coraliomargarita sp. SDUM461003]MDQ8209632.1 hypothetical protein [Coraliomargarita sp. SDUM461003]